jgi:hypothetical protein
MRWLAWLVVLGVGCGGATASSSVPRPRPATPPAALADEETDPLPNVKVKGLTGTLNKDDVHQTMDERKEAIDACIREVKRRHRWISGTIRFDFAVDAEGAVEEALVAQSDIGHRPLEQCLGRVMRETQFPYPAGRAQARFSYDMHVDGTLRRPATPLNPKIVKRLVRKKGRKVLRGCKVRRYKQRFDVTMYVGRRGKVLSASAVPKRPLEDDKLDCVVQAVGEWRLPKQKRLAKVTFPLR